MEAIDVAFWHFAKQCIEYLMVSIGEVNPILLRDVQYAEISVLGISGRLMLLW